MTSRFSMAKRELELQIGFWYEITTSAPSNQIDPLLSVKEKLAPFRDSKEDPFRARKSAKT